MIEIGRRGSDVETSLPLSTFTSKEREQRERSEKTFWKVHLQLTTKGL
jgi:hypothetical protein